MLQAWGARAKFTIVGTLVFLTCALILLSIIARQYRNLSASEASLTEKSQALEREHARLLTNEAELRTQNQKFDAALNNMSHGLAMFDRDARLVVCNERYREMRGLSPEQAKPGLPLREIVAHSHDSCGFPASVDKYLAEISASLSAETSCVLETKDSDGRLISIKHDPMPDGGWVAMFEDITDRRASEAKITLLAHNDLLTGIANRPYFLEQIDKARERLRTSGQPFSVLMLDLDRFKHVNDSLGHAAGDVLLKETAKRLATSLRATDVLARIGGDEFAIIQTPPRHLKSSDDATPIMRESAIALSNRIIDTIGQPYDFDGHKVVIGTSIGIAMAPNHGVRSERADEEGRSRAL